MKIIVNHKETMAFFQVSLLTSLSPSIKSAVNITSKIVGNKREIRARYLPNTSPFCSARVQESNRCLFLVILPVGESSNFWTMKWFHSQVFAVLSAGFMNTQRIMSVSHYFSQHCSIIFRVRVQKYTSPVDGNSSICRNVGKTSKFYSAYFRKSKS